MLADAAEAGDIRQNPARGVRIGNLTKSPAAAPVKALKPSEAATLIAALPDPYRLLVRVPARNRSSDQRGGGAAMV
jgi:hypothetical protein